MGNNFGDCPSLTPRFALSTQYQKSYDTKHSIYLESVRVQCQGNYICIAYYATLISWFSAFALFFKWGRMSITDNTSKIYLANPKYLIGQTLVQVYVKTGMH